MTDEQWNGLERMVKDTPWFSALLSIGEVKLVKKDDRFELEYPTHYVTLKKDKRVNGTDLLYLRFLYNAYLSSMSI
jgi:hypothetical protein